MEAKPGEGTKVLFVIPFLYGGICFVVYGRGWES